MPAIHLTGLGGAHRAGLPFARAALAALAAPSVLRTQPWRWRIDDAGAELLAEPGRLATISCGAVLHHATVALAADGVGVEVVRLPRPDVPGSMALLRYDGVVEPDRRAQRLARAIAVRGSDRRPIGSEPVPEAQLRLLVGAAAIAGAGLHPLAVNPGTRRPRPAGWAVIATAGDGPRDWLAAGEAISAVLLNAAAEGLVTDAVTERTATVPPTLARRLPPGAGHPAAVVRFGVAPR